jgi:hypothetical protein
MITLIGFAVLVFVGIVGTISMNRQIKKIVDKLD